MKEEPGVVTSRIKCVLAVDHETIAASEAAQESDVIAETERVAEQPEGETANNDVNGVLHHDVDLVLLADQAALQKSEPFVKQTQH